jgi:hypothetical protein
MIVANVVPRPPRSSYNLLNLRDCGSVGDLVYRVLDLVVDACGVVSCGERRTDAGTGRCVASVACTTHTRCVCRFRSDRVGDRERRVYNWRIALCETAWIDTEQNGHIRTRPTNVQTRAPRGSAAWPAARGCVPSAHARPRRRARVVVMGQRRRAERGVTCHSSGEACCVSARGAAGNGQAAARGRQCVKMMVRGVEARRE